MIFLRITIILIFCVVVSSSVLPQKSSIDPRLLPIVSEFFFMKNGNMLIEDGLIVKIGPLKEPSWVGLCEYGIFANTVTISDREYDKNEPLQLHSTVMHELGHAVLNRGHYPPETLADVTSFKYLMLYLKIKAGGTVPSHREDFCPISIMYPYSFSDYCYLKHFQEYMEELFDKKF